MLSAVKQFIRADSGASLIEYTVLLGGIVVAVIVVMGAVGTWVSGTWATLNSRIAP